MPMPRQSIRQSIRAPHSVPRPSAMARRSGTSPMISPLKTVGMLKKWKARGKMFPMPSESRLESRISLEALSEEDDPDLRLEDQLTNEKLVHLEQVFQEADEDCGGGLDMDEFRNAMRQAMGEHLTDHELDILFMKVDTNCDGTVDWDEYLSYMLLEYQEKDHMSQVTQKRPLPQTLRSVRNMNRYQRFNDQIVQLVHMPTLAKTKTSLYKVVEDTGGKYISVSKEGVVNFWSTSLSHIRGFKIEAPFRNVGLWVVDLVYMPNLHMAAIATTSATITFYEFTTKFEPFKVITELEIAATCMDYWADPNDTSHSILLWGDARGNISALEFSGCQTVCFLQPSLNKSSRSRIPFHEIQKGQCCGVKAYKMPKVHDDFVMKLKYYAALECFFSCCQTKSSSMFVGDLKRRKSSYFCVPKGIRDFDYSRANNVIVTGGKDTVVRVWNPYVPAKPVMLFRGHNSAIVHVIINEQKEHIISVSEDKEIYIFDLNTQTCIQTITRKWVPLGSKPISAACFNCNRQALILATNQLAIFEHHELALMTQQLTSHQHPVTVVLYNSLFNQVVSSGADSIVCVWDPKTGERVMQFIAHQRRTETGETESVEITAMSFDRTLRRLITASRDGSVRIWNFNNGALLRELPTTDDSEVAAVACVRGRILTAGWNRVIRVYVDAVDDDRVVTWPEQHTEDVLAMACLSPSLVASAAYDGEIILWSLETGHVIASLNAHKDTSPCLSAYETYRSKVERSAADRLTDSFRDDSSDMSLMSLPSVMSRSFKPMRRPSLAMQQVTKRQSMGFVNMSRKTNPLSARMGKGRFSICIEEKEQNNSGTPLREEQSGERESDAAVEALLFLETRTSSRAAASLVAGGVHGWVHFWSVHPEGGLIGQFNAGHTPGETITAMTTDEGNEFLITGGSDGYIKVWDIMDYCLERRSVDPQALSSRRAKYLQFPYLKASLNLRKKVADQSKHAPPPLCSNPRKTWRAPELINSFRGHLRDITCLEYINHDENIVSASSDCSIRVWTVYGEYVGIFGQEVPWSAALHRLHALYQDASKPTSPELKKSDSEEYPHLRNKRKVDPTLTMAPLRRTYDQHRLPSDVRRVASAATQRVFYRGMRPHWRLAKNIVLIWIPLMNMMRMSRRDNEEKQKLQQQEDTAKAVEAMSSTQGTSTVLGKSYKKRRRHQRLPQLPKPRLFHNQCDVYSTLPFHKLAPVNTNMQTPDAMIEMAERQKNVLRVTIRQPTKKGVMSNWKRVSYRARQSIASKGQLEAAKPKTPPLPEAKPLHKSISE